MENLSPELVSAIEAEIHRNVLSVADISDHYDVSMWTVYAILDAYIEREWDLADEAIDSLDDPLDDHV